MNTITPRLDDEALSQAHVVLCHLKIELDQAGRHEEANVLAYVDLIILVIRNRLKPNKLGGL
jgi:hypothetical protein